MLSTLLGKFTFFFWFIFFMLNIPIYIFGNYYVKGILQETEKEKIVLMIETLEPTLALNIFLEQKQQLNNILQNILKFDTIETIKFKIKNQEEILYASENKIDSQLLFNYSTVIKDPLLGTSVATIELFYSNRHLEEIHRRVLTILSVIFVFSLIVFMMFNLYMRKNFNSLQTIANALKEYIKSKKNKKILLETTSTEIVTISEVANEMMDDIDDYVTKLESFNQELKKQVQEKIKEIQNQENLIIHQSRQAAMGEMLESIAHQWRQPLNIIGIAAANIDMQYKFGTINDAEFEDKMEIISLNLDYMSTTIDDFRNFLHPGREVQSFNPYKSVQETLLILQAQLKNNGITTTINAYDNILYEGHENEFKQIVFILIHNAKDALKTDKNHTDSHIEISIYEKEGFGYVEVSDNGGGIKEDIIHSIFDAYFTTKFSSQGTGIGLYIAKNIIESRMKGKLSVTNLKDGACFSIKIALSKGEER